MPTFDTVTSAVVVLGLALTDEGFMTEELKVRVDTGVLSFSQDITPTVDGVPPALIVCGSHSFQRPDMARFNEARKAWQYIASTYPGFEDWTLLEEESDSIQMNLAMLRYRAPNLSHFVAVGAAETELRVAQATEAIFPYATFGFIGCPEPDISAGREEKLRRDFDCITKVFARMQEGDPLAFKHLLKDGVPNWHELRKWHHETCPAGPHGHGTHFSEMGYGPDHTLFI